jgi:hypothetical protein
VTTWALAALFHVEVHGLVWREPLLAPKLSAAAVVAAALAALWRPGVPALLALACAELADTAVLLPEVPNHWLLAALVDVAWLLGRAGAREPAALVRRVRAPLLVAVAVFYLWTGTWKLNADFVRPEVSCAVVSWERVLGFFRWLPDAGALRLGVIGGTLLVELVGPVLLLVPRTRAAAVVGFLGFHLLLGLDAVKVYLNFSSVMFALLLLYLPDGALARLGDLLAPRTRRVRGVVAAAWLTLALAGVAAGPAAPLYLVGRWFVWLPYAVALLALVALAVAGAPRGADALLPAGSARSLAWIVPLAVLANGAAPVLGLKTRTSWQMYSNIRLEPAASNHFLFPRSLDVAGALADPVTVVASDSRRLADVTGPGLALPWLEFRRRVAATPEASVTWERRGVRHATARVADDPELSPPPLVVRKLLVFRPLGPGAAVRCDW